MQIGVMVSRASLVSRYNRSSILPLSSIRKTISNYVRKAYRESTIIFIRPETIKTGSAGMYIRNSYSDTVIRY
jgi:hypothetical protein